MRRNTLPCPKAPSALHRWTLIHWRTGRRFCYFCTMPQDDAGAETFVSANRAASIIGVSLHTLLRWIRLGLVKGATRTASSWRIPTSSCERLKRQPVQVKEATSL